METQSTQVVQGVDAPGKVLSARHFEKFTNWTEGWPLFNFNIVFIDMERL